MLRFSTRLFVAAVIASVSFAGETRGEFLLVDDFDSYSVGAINGQGNWTADAGLFAAGE